MTTDLVGDHVITPAVVMNAIAIVMVEGEAVGVDEATFCEAVTLGLESVSSVTFINSHGLLTFSTYVIM